MRPTFSNPRFHGARFNASAPPLRRSSANRSKRTARSNDDSRPSRSRLPTRKRRSAFLTVSRIDTSPITMSDIQKKRSKRLFTSRIAICLIGSCPTRRSTSSTKPAHGLNCAPSATAAMSRLPAGSSAMHAIPVIPVMPRDARDRGYTNSRRPAQYFEPSEFENIAATVAKQDIDDVISRWTGIPVSALQEEETAKLLRIEDELHKRIVSQVSAISALARAIRRSRAGLKNPHRPVGSFLFLGPTGVGKTEVARSLADFLFGSERAMIRFDMSEFMEKHSISKLIGSPPGYVGYEEGGQLTERIRRNPYSVLLLDEIEKAHPDIFNILLQVFEDGILTDAIGNTVDFKNVIIIMTSNIGARFIHKGGQLGFQSSRDDTIAKTEERVMASVKEVFNPEFINRLDEVIVFEPLTDEDLLKIVVLLVEQLNRTLKLRKLEIRVTTDAQRWIVDQTCTDRNYGARPLRRALQRHIEDPISEALIQGRLNSSSIVEVYLENGALNYRPLIEDAFKEEDEVLIG
ncbi:MAG: ATP-dependent Clp protease ATP-binding subunit [Acidobacteria bacterium]|nr:ATP-dependent Clp protease ATP-binding subunit [Acidobacteriota bacterium]